jgi:hypothetical protein
VREYAVSEYDHRRILIALHCDGCGATIKPHAEIKESGWVKCGFGAVGDPHPSEMNYCPACAYRAK